LGHHGFIAKFQRFHGFVRSNPPAASSVRLADDLGPFGNALGYLKSAYCEMPQRPTGFESLSPAGAARVGLSHEVRDHVERMRITETNLRGGTNAARHRLSPWLSGKFSDFSSVP
jgi:hypothetical protein